MILPVVIYIYSSNFTNIYFLISSMKLFTGVVPISVLALWLNLGTAIWAPADVERILRGALTGDTLPHDSTIWWKDIARILAILDNFTWHPSFHNKEALGEYFANICAELTQIKGKLLALDMAKLGIKDTWEAQIFPVKIAKFTTPKRTPQPPLKLLHLLQSRAWRWWFRPMVSGLSVIFPYSFR